MFWSYLFGLFIISLIFPYIFALLSAPLLGLTALVVKISEKGEEEIGSDRNSLPVIAYPVMALVFILNVYILSGWSAYVASRAWVYSSSPEVTHKWFYFVVGFFLCHGPLAWMASKEGQGGSSGSCLHILIAMVMFIIFSIWPKLMGLPYGWLLDWIYS